MREPWLDELEGVLTSVELATALVTVASVAGREVPLDEGETRAATRRALLVLAAGGDPSRGLDLGGPAVERLAAELRSEERREALEDGLERLRVAAVGLPHATEAVHALLADLDTAWSAFACAVLAEALVD